MGTVIDIRGTALNSNEVRIGGRTSAFFGTGCMLLFGGSIVLLVLAFTVISFFMEENATATDRLIRAGAAALLIGFVFWKGAPDWFRFTRVVADGAGNWRFYNGVGIPVGRLPAGVAREIFVDTYKVTTTPSFQQFRTKELRVQAASATFRGASSSDEIIQAAAEQLVRLAAN